MNQVLAVICLLLTLTSCSTLPKTETNERQKNATGRQGAIVTSSPTATGIGAAILKNGGNAVDAAIAATFAFWTDPTNTSLGGRGQLLLRLPTGEVFCLDGMTQVPSAYRAGTKGVGFSSVPTPGLLKLLGEMHRKWGKIPWKSLVEPSIKGTEEGFVVPYHLGAIWQSLNSPLRGNEAMRTVYLKKDLTSYREGDLFRNPAHGNFLRKIAEQGADIFYQGEVGKSIVAEAKLGGGFISGEDLKKYKVIPGKVETFSYNGWKIHSAGGNAGGRIVRRLFEAYGKEKDKSNRTLAVARAMVAGYSPKMEDADPEEREGDTTHLSVIDEKGMAVALTSSIGPRFGSMVGSGYGFPFAFSYAMASGRAVAGKRDETKVSPTLALGPQGEMVVVGAGGDRRIPSAVFQVLLLRIEGKSLGDAVFTPRMAFKKKEFRLQQGYSKGDFDAVASLGFATTWTGRSHERHTGIIHAAEYSAREGSFISSADPAYDGVPAAP